MYLTVIHHNLYVQIYLQINLILRWYDVMTIKWSKMKIIEFMTENEIIQFAASSLEFLS